MHHGLIFGSMMTTGLVLFGAVAWIQIDRTAFTSRPAKEDAIQMDISPLRAAEEAPAEPEDEVLQLPPVEIRSRHRATPPAAAPRPAPTPASTPCSPWEEIGPERVNDGVPSGVRRVRRLC